MVHTRGRVHSLDADTSRGLCYLAFATETAFGTEGDRNMTRFRWWLAGLVMLALPASVAVGQSAALATVALACPLGHEAAQPSPASHEAATICPVQRLLQELLDQWALL